MGVARDFFTERGDEVEEIHIIDGYDPEAETQKWLDVDVVIIQAPINWFSTPESGRSTAMRCSTLACWVRPS